MRKEFEKRATFTSDEIESWFDYAKNEEIADNVIWFNEPHHFEDVYFYLIRGSEADMLIDTGMGIKPIKPTIDSLRNLQKPLIVTNTHWHFDHIGGNYEFENVHIPFRASEVYGIKRGWSPKDLERYFFDQGFWHGMPTQLNLQTFNIKGFEKTSFIQNEYDLGDRIITPIYTPGHTPGGVVFYDKTYKLLFTGDLLYEGPLYAFEQESSPDHYLESLVNISKLPVNRIHPGHNHPDTSNYPNLINETIELFKRAKNKEPWDQNGEFENTVEYHHANKTRRLKVIVNKDYVKKL